MSPMIPRRHTVKVEGMCGYGDALICAHDREAHKVDETDGTKWCDECWADDDPALHEISYHYFDQGVYARV